MIDWAKVSDDLPKITSQLTDMMIKDGLPGLIALGIDANTTVSITYKTKAGRTVKISLGIETDEADARNPSSDQPDGAA